MEELRKIDSLSIVYLPDRVLTDVNCCSAARRLRVAGLSLFLSRHAFLHHVPHPLDVFSVNQETGRWQVLGAGRDGPCVTGGLLVLARRVF